MVHVSFCIINAVRPHRLIVAGLHYWELLVFIYSPAKTFSGW